MIVMSTKFLYFVQGWQLLWRNGPLHDTELAGWGSLLSLRLTNQERILNTDTMVVRSKSRGTYNADLISDKRSVSMPLPISCHDGTEKIR